MSGVNLSSEAEGAVLQQVLARVGVRVRDARRARGVNQRDLAAQAGVSRTTLNRLELGHLSDIQLSSLQAIGAALGVGLDDLFTDG